MSHPGDRVVSEMIAFGCELTFRTPDGDFFIRLEVTPAPANIGYGVYFVQADPQTEEEAMKLKDPIGTGFFFSNSQLLMPEKSLLERALQKLQNLIEEGQAAVAAAAAEQTHDTEAPSS